ncbi:hypothetical protein [Streptomyces sp. Mg1]|uniref:hypothetical protein n=1 Tax=Streptomyces sp. Mg1 TaxID=465541 RepID=UPI00017EA941|nr:hypothetical protein [Streptomyces sp. Mg1]AKL64345.1 hypothetical protein M444_01580 [Streptomyces sp. Mg1]EDX20378.1 hypothetical protein SSAG_00169 [Streptomyces sp. Mg1]
MGIRYGIGALIAVTALLLAGSGIATLSRGWLLPWQRRHIVRVRLFGWAQLLIAIALGTQLIGLLAVDSVYRTVFTMPGTVMLLFALVLITRAQRPRGTGQGG